MRIFITALVLILSLQSITKADNIRDFQIEGMSIGDSLLNYYSEKEIKNQKKNFYPKSKKIYMIEFFITLYQILLIYIFKISTGLFLMSQIYLYL